MAKKITKEQWVDLKMFLCEIYDPKALDNELWISLLDGFLLQFLLRTKEEEL